MAQPRLTYHETNNNTTTVTWTAPAGVETIWVQVYNNTTRIGQMFPLTVTPGTTYSITRVVTGYTIDNPNTFGSIWSWTGGRRLRIYWVE